jgi:CRP-like cAMP-binding protein
MMVSPQRVSPASLMPTRDSIAMPQRTSLLATKLSTFIELNDKEIACLIDLQATPLEVESGTELIAQGERGHVAYILQRGWGCSFKMLVDGGRQIITFPVAGDCVGLRSILLRTADHSFSALTDVLVSRVEVSRMLALFSDFPHLGAAILWSTSRDEAITVEHLASIGRRTAIERTAHFFLELCERLRMTGLATETEFDCPLSQYVLADALGLSSIHINRVLRELREMQMLTFQGHRVTIHNRAALKALAGYEHVEESTALIRRPTYDQ